MFVGIEKLFGQLLMKSHLRDQDEQQSEQQNSFSILYASHAGCCYDQPG